MIHHPAKPKPAKRGGEGSLCVSPVMEDRAQHGLGCLPEVAIKLDSMWLPMLQLSLSLSLFLSPLSLSLSLSLSISLSLYLSRGSQPFAPLRPKGEKRKKTA